MMVLGFLLVLGPLVTVHELGHLLVGRVFGIKADAFSIGFGKELCGWNDKRGTRWKVSALPLGGYVQFAGDMNPASIPDDAAAAKFTRQERAEAFQFQPLWQRALVVAAGPATNFLVAIAILASFNYAYGRLEVAPVVKGVVEGNAAAEIGIKAGDRFVELDGEPVGSFEDVRSVVVQNPGETLKLKMDRGGETIDLDFTIPTIVERDRFGNEFRIGRLGVYSVLGEYFDVGPFEAVGLAVTQTGDIVVMMVNGIWQIITGRRPISELGGPIKIAKFSGEQLSLGWREFTYFAALISINLAFINLLPIPALDGGHLAFYAAEAVRRKPVGARGHELAYRTGVAFVLALMVFVTINDLASLPIFGR
ncbi:RIP metalloprotease RseP [Altererythrobacter aquiaggeris]|uniref:RIP metalloprotease RseP n=1 Tax=Aestuarierythrobacter aquiaggeris TaxID=1898396 RepID=UPI0030165511